MLLEWLRQLAQAGRSLRLTLPSGKDAWLAAEHVALVGAAYPEAAIERLHLAPPRKNGSSGNESGVEDIDREAAALYLVRGWAESSGPFTAAEMADSLSLNVSDVAIALAQLENEGLALRGSFRPGAADEEFCDRRILARIHRAPWGVCAAKSSRCRSPPLCAFCSDGRTRPADGRPAARAGCWTSLKSCKGLRLPPPLGKPRCWPGGWPATTRPYWTGCAWAETWCGAG